MLFLVLLPNDQLWVIFKKCPLRPTWRSNTKRGHRREKYQSYNWYEIAALIGLEDWSIITQWKFLLLLEVSFADVRLFNFQFLAIPSSGILGVSLSIHALIHYVQCTLEKGTLLKFFIQQMIFVRSATAWLLIIT